MTEKLAENILKLNQYLLLRTGIMQDAFRALAKDLEGKIPEIIFMHLTYQNIEAGAKFGDKWKIFSHFEEIVSLYDIDELYELKHSDRDVYEDFVWSKSLDLRYFQIESWLIYCLNNIDYFKEKRIPVYFKHNIDSLEILDLITGEIKFEKNELKTYYENNIRDNSIDINPYP